MGPDSPNALLWWASIYNIHNAWLHRGRGAPTSPSLASRPPCLCRAHLLCRPASPKLRWALSCSTPVGLPCQGSSSAQAQMPGGEGQDWRVCMWPKRQLGAQDSVSCYEGPWPSGLQAPTGGLWIKLGTFNTDGWGQACGASAWGPGWEPLCRARLRLAQGAPGVLGRPRPPGRLQLGCSLPGACLCLRGT